MRKIIYTTLSVLLLASAFAFKTVQHYADILKELQMDTADAKESIFFNFQDGVLDFPYSKVVTKFALGKRTAAVKELGDYVKAYTESSEFAEKYKEAREAARPQGIASAEEKIKERLEQIIHDIETNEEGFRKAKGDMKKLYAANLESLKKEQKALSNPSDPEHNYYVNLRTEIKASEIENASEDEKYWLQDYPPTVKELIKKRLTEFLELTKDIDFNAKLIQRGSKMEFANPALEAKSWEWKRCFRCGKETIVAARSYAQQWLATLQ